MTKFDHRSINNLEATWLSVIALCTDLSEAQWKTATGCPGWTVQDNIAHLIDYESRALGRPAPDHQPGAALETVEYLGQFLPLVAAKRAAAPDGTSIAFRVNGVTTVNVEISDGRGVLASVAAAKPTVTLTMSAPTFAALTGGRTDIPNDVVVSGDAKIAKSLLDHMGFLP